MSWEHRLRQAAYTAEGGERITWGYENVTTSIDLHATAFEFVDAHGTYLQFNGHSGRKIPVRAIFWGADYDLEADAYEAALRAPGVGKLEHPVYGVLNVVPFGTITRRDNLKTGANEAVVEVLFWETNGLAYPSVTPDTSQELGVLLDAHVELAAETFEERMELDTVAQQSNFRGRFNATLASASAGLRAIAEVQAEVQQAFDDINDSITNSLDVLIGQPLTLAFQTMVMIQAPARALNAIQDQLSSYRNLANQIFSGTTESSNEFLTSDLFASTYTVATIRSILNAEFVTRSEALAAADSLLVQWDELVVWRDGIIADLELVDVGGAYAQLQAAVSLTAGFIAELAFTLRQERRIILQRPRALIELVAELYGEVDGQLDFFIESNDLSGAEILELPAGRQIVYYI